MLKFCAITAAVLTTGLTLSACAAGSAEAGRSADAAKAQCRTSSQPGGGSSMDCTLWERTTTSTTTTTTLPNGETTTTVARTGQAATPRLSAHSQCLPLKMPERRKRRGRMSATGGERTLIAVSAQNLKRET